MAVKVIVPSKTYNEKAFGVQFVNGEATFEDEQLANNVAETLGYKVVQLDGADSEPEAKGKAPAKRQPAKRTAKKAEE